MKVIFLDIDGVLNHEKYYISRCDSDNRPYPLSEFDTDAVERLNEITDVTGQRLLYHRHGGLTLVYTTH